MVSVRFTRSSLDGARPKEDGKRYAVWDPKTPGLCLRIIGKGSKSWYWDRRVRSRHERVRLGSFRDITLRTAQKMAAQLNGDLVG